MAGLFAGQPLFKTIGGAIAGAVTTLTITASLILTGAQITGDLVPAANDTYDVGTPALSWQDVNASGTARVEDDVIVGGQSVCREDGTNCPAGVTVPTLQQVLAVGNTATTTATFFGGITVGTALSATGTLSVTGLATFGTATGTQANFNAAAIGALTGGSGAFSSLTSAGQAVCLADGTNCPASGGGTVTSSTWQFNQALGLIYPTTSTFAMVLGASASATAPFYWETRSPTSSLQIGRVGNANFFVGTSTYGGGLNSLFTLNGDDAFFQSNIGVLGIGYFGTATATSMFANAGTFGTLASNSATIGGGTINGTIIGGSSAAAGSFTTLNASGLSALANITFTGATGTSGSVTGIWSMGTATGTNGNFNSSQIGALTGGTGAFSSVTVGGQSVCLANGTNCPSSYSTLTVTTLSSTNINVRNIREANGSTASSTIVLSGRSGEIDTSTTPRPTSTLLVVGGVPRTLAAMNASTTNCIYWGPEWIRDSWDRLQLKPTVSWTNSTGSGAIVWRVRAESIDDAESFGTAWTGTSAFATGTASTAMLNQNDAMDALTVGGATTGTPMRFELCRIGAQAGDTFGKDAYPNSLKIEYGLGSYSD
jgi:hypothetical protein